MDKLATKRFLREMMNWLKGSMYGWVAEVIVFMLDCNWQKTITPQMLLSKS